MTIYPLPDVGISVVDMVLDTRSEVVETLGAKSHVSSRGRPRWAASMETGNLRRETAQTVRAWWHRQVTGLHTFTTWHPEQPYPVTYPNGFAGMNKAIGGAFDGTCAVNSISATQLILTALPADFEIKAGDLVGLVETGQYGLFEIADDATGDINGIITINVHPFIATSVFTTSATANFAKPLAEMQVDPQSYSGPRTPSLPPISFSARQVTY